MDDIKRAVRGRVLLPGDDGFDEARRAWNLAVEQPAKAVVEAEDADDVAAVVKYARSAGLTVAAQPNGHGASGDTDGTILLRTTRLNELEIRPGERTARAGAGVQWGEVLAAAGPHGLTGIAGSSPIVGVTGYTLGGGLGWFSRKYGFAAESVRAFDVVDAAGERIRVSEDNEPELFWALRGGGGSFALVTAVEFDLQPAPELYGGRMLWPADRAPQVVAAFREITAGAPDELSLWLDLIQFPGSPPLVGVDSAFLGSAADGQGLLGRLNAIEGMISDSRATLPVADLGSITAEPTDPSPGMGGAELLTALDDQVVERLLAAVITPLIMVQLRHLGGALARPSSIPSGSIVEPYVLYMLGAVFSPDMKAGIQAKKSELVEALRPNISGGKPYNFLAPGEDSSAAFPEETMVRLREIKKRCDPHGVFRANYPINA